MPRAVETDAEGRFEAANLRPGTYRVEVVTHQLQEVRADRRGACGPAGVARVDAKLELGAMTETVTVSAEAINNITLESQAIARGARRAAAPRPAAQQPRHPVLPAPEPERPRRHATTSSSWAAGPTASPTSRTARPRRTRSSARSATPPPASTPSPSCRCCRTPTAPSTAGWPAWSSPPSAAATATAARAFYDFNSDGLNALTYNQKLAGAERGDPNCRHPRAPLGREPGRAAPEQQDLLLRELRGIEQQGDLRRRPRHRAHRGHAQRRLPRHDHHARAIPLTGAAVPGPGDPGQPHRPRGPAASSNFFYPLPNQAARSRAAIGVFQQFVPADAQPPPRRPPLRPRGHAERLALPARQLPVPRTRATSPSRRGNALTNLGILNTQAQHRVRDRGVDEDPLADGRERVPRRLQLRQLASARATFVAADVAARAGARERAQPGAGPARLPADSVRGRLGRDPAHEHHRPAAATWTARSSQNAFSISNNLSLDHGRPLPEGGRRSTRATPPTTASASA